MEHEVYLPFSPSTVRSALADRTQTAGCVPGLQLDASTGESTPQDTLRGRLRVRVHGSTITYRGTLRLTPEDGGLHVEGDGFEARGGARVLLTLTLVPRPAEDGEGTRLVCSGTVRAAGRLAEVEEKVAAATGTRLLDRFGSRLSQRLAEAPRPRQADGGIGEPDDNEPAIPGIPGPEQPERRQDDQPPAEDSPDDQRATTRDDSDTSTQDESPDTDDTPESDDEPAATPLYETEIPPPSLASDDEHLGPEAAHARRTMIGRSAEEVDHAPPRGRYAPTPPPGSESTALSLRWLAPAAALAVAGAVVVTRALRPRRRRRG
ncbi:SRPBCC family protein [Streptomyces sp. NPDC005438]|uniref:SRPBCC family protein n=1 Tax=Streptomyces sp. NPDC005438 TaxID=3156880 RepID=UPI0033A919B9